MKKEYHVVGLMSGTSLDGIDAALVRITEEEELHLDTIFFNSYPFSKEVKEAILDICNPETARIENISSMNFLLGELFAEASLKVITEAGFNKSDIDLISSHGQTIYHQPTKINLAGYQVASTFQIGDISVIAERTGITTVGDFRTRDMAAGGQGAPLVPFADYILFKNKEFGRVLLNIGGIANLTVLPKNSTEVDCVAYDTGPGNMIIDAFMKWATNGEKSYDAGGEFAAKGMVNKGWLAKLLNHSYYQVEIPKSTGREMFGIQYAEKLWLEAEDLKLSLEDRLATVTALTAYTIAGEIKKHIEPAQLKEVLVSGGGYHNQTLLKELSNQLPELEIQGTNHLGVSPDAKEAMIFALLGYKCLKQQTNNLPSATGATKPVIMGKISW
ncbi:anhydro-N-acetylmuramic acid kinase [Bacillus sp. 31A1R]|uniref:Anhydro-N-acetylmuramic acid kinase n=1 Tax=Robertmurraya mangrovi TaxID=3098077 RepID=A0ABU5J2S4_9BACI|nr:anhydro-N-acetylmuramic acid kinase [Bacillus sp. 31A1R]MDZ5473704.1 anhydro-N-acetylmuramic acid kinase [Bacillus sp. 31A1R]